MTSYRWRIADCQDDVPVPCPDDVPSLEMAMEAAGRFLGTSPVGEAVALIWSSTAKGGWYPVTYGTMEDRMEWHPWPSGRQGAELATLATLEPADEPDAAVIGDVIAGKRGEDVVTISVDPGQPSRVAAMAAQNRTLFADEQAAQEVPARVIDSLPLDDTPAAIESGAGS